MNYASETNECSDTGNECIDINEWHFSVAIGVGTLTNPLHGGDHIPLLVVPFFSYYGERLFLENTTLGYTLLEEPSFDVSIILEPNADKAFFERSNLRNIISPEFLSSVSAVDNSEPKGEEKVITIDDIGKRQWAIDVGLLGHWYITPKSKITMQWLHDVTSRYSGHHAKVSVSHEMILPIQQPLKVRFEAGLHWKSQHLVDYYYGLSARDNVEEAHFYQGSSTLSSFASIAVNYQLTTDWQLKFSVKKQFMGSGITNSPLINSNDVTYVFLGGVYAF